MVHEIIVGRRSDDFKKYGKAATGYIGKNLIGRGEDTYFANKVMIDLLRPHLILICGKRGSGKCVEENTLITLDDGSQIPIKDLRNEDNKKIYGLNNKLKISPVHRTEFFERNVDLLYHVILRSGRSIKLTPEHPLLTINGWRETKELTTGSRIATSRKIKTFGNKIMKDFEIKLLAYLIAEGHLSNSFVLFSNEDQDIIKDFSTCVNNFDNNLKIEEHSKFGCFRVSKARRKADSSAIKRDELGRFSKGSKVPQLKSSLRIWLERFGLYGKLSKDKFVPQEIFQLPKYQLSLFLNRLFSCDGSIYKHKSNHGYSWEISFASSSENLIRQVQHLLLRFEILSSIREKNAKLNNKQFLNFELTINGLNVIKFINEIGFFSKKEERQKEALRESVQLLRNPNLDAVPKEIWSVYRPQNWAFVGRELGYSIPKGLRSSINYSPSREKLKLIARADRNSQMYLLATSDIFWDEIVDIKELHGNFKVCDLTVPEFHNFVANDIIVHNSYSGGILMEEMALLEDQFRNNLTSVIIDTMGIYWSMKTPNEEQIVLLDQWKLKPKGLEDRVKVFVPYSQKKEFLDADIPVDFGISVPPHEFSPEEWSLAFQLPGTNPIALGLQKTINRLKERNERFSIDDLISDVKDDRSLDTHVKSALDNMLDVADKWGVFGEEGVKMDEVMKPGRVNVFDVSKLRESEAWSVRNLLVALVSRKIYESRVTARKQEELVKMGAIEMKERFPMVWLFIDEAHNFCPSDTMTVSSGPILTIVKQGREPGISLVPMTQMPNKIHQDVVSQADMVISHRLTSKSDLNALHSVMQTYLMEDLWKSIDDLPKTRGTAIILDDNSERIFSVQLRPRLSWHAGEAAIAVNE